MRTRRSPRNQDALFRALFPRPAVPRPIIESAEQRLAHLEARAAEPFRSGRDRRADAREAVTLRLRIRAAKAIADEAQQ